MVPLNDGVALVTGASRGIGRHVALALAREGARLALVARNAEDLERVVREIRALGRQAVAFPCDLGDASAIPGLVEAVHRTFGRIDVLVNNAGVDNLCFFEGAAPADLERQVALNLTASILLTRHVVPKMLERRRGHIVNMASLAGFHGVPHDAVYGATKAALLAFTSGLRVELHGRGVSASAVAPGFVVGDGLYERHRRTAGRPDPKLLGTTTVEAVVQAVLEAIRRDRPEVIVNSRPMAPVLFLYRVSPRLGLTLLRVLSRDHMRHHARVVQAGRA